MPNKPAKTVLLTGKGKYVRVRNLDKFGKWSLMLYLDKPSLSTWADLKKEGIMNHLKRDEDGEFVRLTRPPKKTFRGVDTPLAPPEVIDNTGKAVTELIGNGSDLTVKITVYYFNRQFDNTAGAAIRMEAVQVNELVPYITSASGTDEQKKAIEGFNVMPPDMAGALNYNVPQANSWRKPQWP
jgi:hypothetical protein